MLETKHGQRPGASETRERWEERRGGSGEGSPENKVYNAMDTQNEKPAFRLTPAACTRAQKNRER